MSWIILFIVYAYIIYGILLTGNEVPDLGEFLFALIVIPILVLVASSTFIFGLLIAFFEAITNPLIYWSKKLKGRINEAK